MNKIKTFLINFWNTDAETKIRTIALGISLINLVLFLLGKKQITVEAETVWSYITTISVVVSSLIACYKNNDYTPIARQYTQAMRAAKKTIAEPVAEDEFITESEG